MINNKKYWLKGGIIGFVLYVFYIIFTISKDIIINGYIGIELGVTEFEQLILRLVEKTFGLNLLIDGMFGIQATKLGSGIIITIEIIIPIIIGVIMGIIYGKIKNKLHETY